MAHWSYQLGSVLPRLVPGTLLKQCCSLQKRRVWAEQVTQGQHVPGVWVLQVHGSILPHCWRGSEGTGKRL